VDLGGHILVGFLLSLIIYEKRGVKKNAENALEWKGCNRNKAQA
jgi:hypothetical protein